MASILGGLVAGAVGKVVKDVADKATGGKVTEAVNKVTVSTGKGKDKDKGSGSSGSTSSSSAASGGSGGKSYPNGYTTKYTGGNAALDAKLADLSSRYSAARERALAGDESAVKEMRDINDWANQARNEAGYAAEYAYDDIENIKKQIGYSSGGGSAGGSSGGTISGSASGTTGTGVNDYSDYIEEMNRAQQEAALAELRAAYEKNLAGMDRTQQSISPTYQAARNQAAGNAARQQQAFNEYAAAYGLNSGAAGQAQLAMSNALQGNLSDIDTAEADALSDLELQRSQTEIDYNNAIAQAKAEGNYQLAQQLYTEKVRVDEALREQMAQAAQQQLAQQQLAAQQSQQSWENQFAMDKYQSGLEQSTKDQMAAYGWSFLETGAMPSQDMLNAMGITEEDAQNYIYTLQSKANTKKYSSGGGGTSGTSGGLTLANAKAAAESGYFGDEVLNVLRKNGYSDGMLTAMYGYEPTSYGSETGGINSARFSAMARSLATQLEGGNTSAILSGLDEVWPDLSNTQRQTLQELLARYGYAYS